MAVVLLSGIVGVSVASAQQLVTQNSTNANVQHQPPMVQTRAAVETVAVASSTDRQSVLDRLVSLRVENVSRKQAVNELAEEARVRIQFRGNLLDAYTTPISIDITNVSLAEALRKILDGTSLTPVPIAGDAVVLASNWVYAGIAQGSLSGRIVHGKTKQPISRATITIDGQKVSATTDQEGRFRMSLAPGEYTARVRALGFVRHSQTVVVSENATVVVDIALEPSASVLDEVVVTGTVVATERKALANPITVITAEEIERRGITRVEQLLRGEVPGVIAMDVGSEVYDPLEPGAMVNSQVYSRGASSLGTAGSVVSVNPLKTYVDGVELVNSTYLGTIDPQSIERIEIIVGPQAATVYGSGAQSGVMQIFTKKGSMQGAPEVTLSLKYGVLQNNVSQGKTPTHTDMLSIRGGSGSEFGYSGNLSYLYTGQWRPALFNRRFGLQGGVTYNRGPVRMSGSVGATMGENGTTHSWVGSESKNESGEWNPSAQAPSQIISRSASQIMGFDMDYNVSPQWSHRLTLGMNLNQFRLTPDAPRFQTPQDTMWRVRNTDGKRTTFSYNTTTMGGIRQWITGNMTLGITGSSGSQLYATGCVATSVSTAWVPCVAWNNLGGSPSSVSVSQPLSDRSWGGFGNWQLGVADQLFLTFGLRGEKNPNYGRAHKIDWTPTNGVSYVRDIGDLTVKLRGSYGSATRPPNAEERLERVSVSPGYEPVSYLSQMANPDLRPSRSRGPQGGIELFYLDRVTLSINRYDQRIDDLIQRVEVDSVTRVYLETGREYVSYTLQYRNAVSLRQHGWEGVGSLRIGAVSLRGTYSWNDSRVTRRDPRERYPSGNMPGDTPIGFPTHTGNVSINYASGRTSVVLNTNIMGAYIASYFRGPRAEIQYERSSARIRSYVRNARIANADQRVRGYMKSDLAMTHRVNGWVSMTMNVTNLGNSYAKDGEYFYPTLGRQTSFGLSLKPFQR